ncbi:MAG: hypothetical protein ABI651_16760, partial [Verrucomicrobiota bacterium]
RADLELLQSGKSLARLHRTEKRLQLVQRAGAVITALAALIAAGWLWQARQTHLVRELAAEKTRLAAEKTELADNLSRLRQANRQRLVQLQVQNAVRLMDGGDTMQSLLPLAEAFENVEGDAAREEMHRLRIASVLDQSPKLARVLVLDSPVWETSFSPDGLRLVALTTNRLTIFDLHSGNTMFSLSHTDTIDSATFTEDGLALLTIGGRGTGYRPGLLDAGRGKSLISSRIGAPLAVSSDGRYAFGLVGTNRNIGRIFATRTGEPVTEEIRKGEWISNANFSDDGRRLALGYVINDANDPIRVDVVEVPSGRALGGGWKWRGPSQVYCFNADGSRILEAGLLRGNTTFVDDVPLWNATNGTLVATLRHERNAASGKVGFTFVDFSPSGRWVLTAPGHSLHVWDASSGAPVGSVLPHAANVFDATVSPDGLMLATADEDGFARVWNPISGRLVLPPLRAGLRANHVRFSPDGRFLAVASHDRCVRVWDLAGVRGPELAIKVEGDPRHAAFSPDGRQIVIGADETRIWDAVTGAAAGPVMDEVYPMGVTRFSPDGRLVVSCAGPSHVARQMACPGAYVWDSTTARLAFPPLVTNAVVRHAEFSPDGRFVVTASDDRSARVWDANTGRPVTPPLKHGGPVLHAAFSPDGRRVLTTCRDGTAQLWDASTGERLGEPLRMEGQLLRGSFTRDGQLIAVGSTAQSARVWNAASGQPVTVPFFHSGEVRLASFSPDASRLLTAGTRPEVKLWQFTETDSLLATLSHGSDELSAASFSGDGKLILSASIDGSVRVWDAATFEPVTPFLQCPKTITHAEFNPANSRSFLASGKDEVVRLWTLGSWSGDAATLADLAELLSGHKPGAASTMRPVVAEDTARLFDGLRAKRPDLFEATPADVLKWHRQLAAEAARLVVWRTALWHWERILAANPKDTDALLQHGVANAELGRWVEAKRDFEAALALEPGDVRNHIRLATALLGTEDLAAYRQVAAQALRRFGGAPALADRPALAELSWALPDAFADPKAVSGLMRDALAQRPRNSLYVRSYAIALYRAGEIEAALTELERYRRGFGPGERFDLLSNFFYVLASHRTGKAVQANRLWQEMAPQFQGWLKAPRTNDGPDWAQRLVMSLLHGEMEILLGNAGRE